MRDMTPCQLDRAARPVQPRLGGDPLAEARFRLVDPETTLGMSKRGHPVSESTEVHLLFPGEYAAAHGVLDGVAPVNGAGGLRAPGAVDELKLSKPPEQVLGMVHTFGGALSRHLPVFAAINDNWSCRPVASQESGTEIPALISHPNQDQFHLLAPFRCRFIRRGVDKPLGPLE